MYFSKGVRIIYCITKHYIDYETKNVLTVKNIKIILNWKILVNVSWKKKKKF